MRIGNNTTILANFSKEVVSRRGEVMGSLAKKAGQTAEKVIWVTEGDSVVESYRPGRNNPNCIVLEGAHEIHEIGGSAHIKTKALIVPTRFADFITEALDSNGSPMRIAYKFGVSNVGRFEYSWEMDVEIVPLDVNEESASAL